MTAPPEAFRNETRQPPAIRVGADQPLPTGKVTSRTCEPSWRRIARAGFQQGEPEPLDAYRKFLEERQARGDFSIVNKKLETEFWRYYHTNAIHSFYPPGSKEESQAFATAPWLQD